MPQHKHPILVAEDDPASRVLIGHSLRKLNYQVSLANNGREAWDLFDKKPFRIIVSDWRMPGFDGLEFCRKVRSRPASPYTYFILLTAERQTAENYELAIEAGIDDFLTKPLDPFKMRTRLHVAERILEFTHKIRELKTLIPICSYCKKIRNDEEYWEQIEGYIQRETGSQFSHGICPDCYKSKVEPEIKRLKAEK